MAESLLFLRRRIASIEGHDGVAGKAVGCIPTGHGGIDHALGGGLARGRVHEFFADEAGSAAGFAGIVARRQGEELLWLREEEAERRRGRLHAAGLAEIGIDPARLILGVLPDPAAMLRAAVDALRCPSLGAVIAELWGDPLVLDLTASRRLALAAEGSGVTALILRPGGTPAPSAAQTRWRIASAPSVPLPANAPGHPAWDLELLRQRGRAAGGLWHVEWNREAAVLRDREYGTETLSGAVVPASADRSAGAIDPSGLSRVG